MKIVHLNKITDLPKAAEAILRFSKEKKVFCFYGEMGAGKTTLIKEICKQLGVTDEGSSPTFSIVNEYKISAPDNKSAKCYHFDLYRLKSESEFFDIGYEDYIFSGNYCFIEWPEKVEHLLPQEVVKVVIRSNEATPLITSNERIITIS
ncbi:MAG TPA: tRNA (adenosine(37)-N6)-threonylcarbamoyltransferase complex ATPase subunit type 1 TsaE [Bacteroidia bacterium]|nr:tRNA (adenosine(37)-N6)-threonylcarbamoyltransferase complex ATPase subunit type 1 TsaE [Bacteroidia bacterium]